MYEHDHCRWCGEPESPGLDLGHVHCRSIMAVTDDRNKSNTVDEAAEALEALNLEILTDRTARLRGTT